MVDLDDRRQQLAGAPVRVVHRADADRGAILFFHGLGVGIADQTKELYSLAREGFVVIGVDNVGHGVRRCVDFETRFSRDNPEFDANILDAVEETIDEVPRIINAAIDTGLTDGSRLGVCGISMGGFVAYGAPLADRRIEAATPILGSPRWKLDRAS
ncbi:MAG: alpha/beta fold hydrolase, partial [bacterium]|nr:alpha/beta fold hydrolase [bacterium]